MSRNPVRRAVAWRRRRSSARLGRYAPHLLPVWVAAPLALLAAGLAAALIYRRVRDAAAPAPDTLDVVRTTITVAGFAGAVLAGVYAYRKQRLAEGDARRADAEQLAARYTAAAEQLGHEKAAVRLAGVYAMARLADDWPEQRQVCIDVLCAYLRMPYEIDLAAPRYREGEREVRLTIIQVMRDHLQDPAVPTTWCGRDLDFTGATFDGGDFVGGRFTGGMVRFARTTFVGGTVSFGGATFSGGAVGFGFATFNGGRVDFGGARFSGATVGFGFATFAGGTVDLAGATFSAGRVGFGGATFAGGRVDFDGATFAGGTVGFGFATFSGARVSFGLATFDGAAVDFDFATFAGGTVDFGRTTFGGGTMSFEGTTVDGGEVEWGPFEPSVAVRRGEPRSERF